MSTARLQVPEKAREDYQKACGQFRHQRLAEAEDSVRSAIQKYQAYIAAWVLLGEILGAKQEPAEARRACLHAEEADPTYLPLYLCLAELNAKDERWDQVANLTTMALELNLAGDAYIYFYRALAYFHLNDLAAAQSNAFEALRLDQASRRTPSCSLLTQIYQAEGKAGSASRCTASKTNTH